MVKKNEWMKENENKEPNRAQIVINSSLIIQSSSIRTLINIQNHSYTFNSIKHNNILTNDNT